MRSDVAASLSQSLDLTHSPVAICFCDEVPEGVPFATFAADHERCAIGQYTHGLEMSRGAAADLGDALKVFAQLTHVRDEDVAAIPVLQDKKRYVIYGPLGAVPVEPDVVLLLVRADQTLILSEASQQLEGGMPPAMGRPACAVIRCCGARAYLDVLTPEVALYAVPGASIEAFAERVTALAGANNVLTRFHQIRRQDIEGGGAPTVAESLARMG